MCKCDIYKVGLKINDGIALSTWLSLGLSSGQELSGEEEWEELSLCCCSLWRSSVSRCDISCAGASFLGMAGPGVPLNGTLASTFGVAGSEDQGAVHLCLMSSKRFLESAAEMQTSWVSLWRWVLWAEVCKSYKLPAVLVGSWDYLTIDQGNICAMP